MNAYYNEIDSYAAAWLRNLVAAGLIPAGDVDERSILDVDPADLSGYRQCHFFSGIGGWPYALVLAGWPADRPVWTGSCPCQPFSSAGKQGGSADERHLWPLWFRLIEVCRPHVIFGEQVAGAVGFGWLDRVFADLEALGYACGAAVLGAHSVGAPHIRQRLYWMADASEQRRQQVATGGLGDAGNPIGRAVSLDRQDGRDGSDTGRQEAHGEPGASGEVRGLGDAKGGFWSNAVWLPCLDGKARRTQPGIFPLASGLPDAMDGLGPVSRVGTLRGAGNAITPQVAAEFIRAMMEVL